MKKLLALLMILFLASPALAEMDLTPLKTDPDWYAFPQGATLNTVYRAVNQPYIGQVDDAFDGDLVAYVDFITLVDRDVTLLRLMASTTAGERSLLPIMALSPSSSSRGVKASIRPAVVGPHAPTAMPCRAGVGPA